VIGLLRLNVDLSGINIWMLKIPKDILILLSILVGVVHGYWRDSTVSIGSMALLSLTIVTSVVFSVPYMPLEAFAAGFRWLLPFAFYLTLGRLREDFLARISRVLQSLLGMGLALQVYQLLFMAGYYGETLSGLSVRNPGFYLFPSSMAGFSMATLYFTTKFERSRRRQVLVYFGVLLSVGLAASGTGVVSLALFTISLLGKREHLALRILAAVGIGVCTLLILPTLTSRQDIIMSLQGRVDIVLDQFNYSNIAFSRSFGAGTNTLFGLIYLRPELSDKVPMLIMDSMVSSSLLNAGLIFLILAVYEIFVRSMRARRGSNLLFLCTFLPFYTTTVLFELFPVNILMFLALSSILSAETVQAYSSTSPHPGTPVVSA
jgi:hypothetical protein